MRNHARTEVNRAQVVHTRERQSEETREPAVAHIKLQDSQRTTRRIHLQRLRKHTQTNLRQQSQLHNSVHHAR